MKDIVWTEYAGNPVITAPKGEMLIADPTFLGPGNTPDGKWHLYAHGIKKGIHHYTSHDGILWDYDRPISKGLRPFLLKLDNTYYLYYERLHLPFRSEIEVRTSRDLWHWSEPVVVLRPSLAWDGRLFRTNGNPCVVQHGSEFRLYYSAALVWLADCGFPEPRYVGLAVGPSPLGPFEKRPEPLLAPDTRIPWRNHGAGAIKVVRDSCGNFWGFSNGIFKDAQSHSRSDIRLMASADGVRFDYVSDHALVGPSGNGWKKALVYALDVREVGGVWHLYFNARDGWFRGTERIGLMTGAPGESHD